MSQLISVQGLCYNLPDGTPVFNDFNFHFGYEKVGIVGKNGIGKTTLLKLIAKELDPLLAAFLFMEKFPICHKK